MTNLFILNETFTNGFNHDLFNLISIASVICGLLVITSKNPIVSVLFLIGLFFNIVGYSMMLGINFIGLSYLLVYVGAVSILFLFLFMLINILISEYLAYNNNGVPLAIFISTLTEYLLSTYYFLRFIEFLIRIKPILPLIILTVKVMIYLYNGLLDFEFTCSMVENADAVSPDSTVRSQLFKELGNNLDTQETFVNKLRALQIRHDLKFYSVEGNLEISAPGGISDDKLEELSQKVGIIDRVLQTKFTEFNTLESKCHSTNNRGLLNAFTFQKDYHQKDYKNFFEK